MTRESRELYQGGDEVMVGTYRDLKNGTLVHVLRDGDRLPNPPDSLASYEWISGDPHWDEEGPGHSHQPQEGDTR